MRAALHLAEHLHEAPVLLFIAGWKRRGEPQLQALYPCAQNVLLACRAVGLGASFTTLHRTFGDGMRRDAGTAREHAECRDDPDRLAARSARAPAAPIRRHEALLECIRCGDAEWIAADRVARQPPWRPPRLSSTLQSSAGPILDPEASAPAPNAPSAAVLESNPDPQEASAKLARHRTHRKGSHA